MDWNSLLETPVQWLGQREKKPKTSRETFLRCLLSSFSCSLDQKKGVCFRALSLYPVSTSGFVLPLYPGRTILEENDNLLPILWHFNFYSFSNLLAVIYFPGSSGGYGIRFVQHLLQLHSKGERGVSVESFTPSSLEPDFLFSFVYFLECVLKYMKFFM